MTNSAPPKLDLDGLIARVRMNTEPHGHEPKGSGPPAGFQGPSTDVTPAAQPAYTAQQLFGLPETEFVRAAYLALLGREARPEELVLQRNRLLAWQASRLRIIRDLRASPEARNHGGKIPGLWKIVLLDRLYWSPPAKAARAAWRGILFVVGLKKRLETVEQTGASATAAIAGVRRDLANDRRLALGQARHTQERISAIRELFEQRHRQLQTRVGDIASFMEQRQQAIELTNSTLQDELRRGLVDHWRAILDQKMRIESLLTALRPESSPAQRDDLGPVIERENEHVLDALYLSFEDRYRGPREEVKDRQRIYLPRVQACVAATGGGMVMDIGCGRGEWLELLGECGIAAEGYDLNRIAIEECAGRGLAAILGDGLQALKHKPEASLSAVTSFHVIEHLPFETLVSLLDGTLRCLRPGGVLILETPNPANLLVAAERFYFDPTHRNPLPSELVSYLVKSRGFTDVEVVPLHPVNWPAARAYDDQMLALLQDKLFGAQDYGVIAWKAAS